MSADQITDIIKAGALVRRQVRVALDMEGIRYVEHKGLLDSVFIITATLEQWRRIQAWSKS